MAKAKKEESSKDNKRRVTKTERRVAKTESRLTLTEIQKKTEINRKIEERKGDRKSESETWIEKHKYLARKSQQEENYGEKKKRNKRRETWMKIGSAKMCM